MHHLKIFLVKHFLFSDSFYSSASTVLAIDQSKIHRLFNWIDEELADFNDTESEFSDCISPITDMLYTRFQGDPVILIRKLNFFHKIRYHMTKQDWTDLCQLMQD